MIGIAAATLLISSGLTTATDHKADCAIFVLKDCPIANQYAPELGRIIKTYTAKGVRFVMIFEDSDVNIESARKHAKTYGLKIPSAVDGNHQMAKRVGVSISPSVVLSSSGKVFYQGRIDDMYASVGRRRAVPKTHDLRNALDSLLAGKKITNPKTEAVGCRLY